jgi:Peptidase MA superfamily
MNVLRILPLIAILGSSAAAQSEFKEVPFASLSDRTISPLGNKALGIRPTEWKHAETPHFVYHFFQSFIAAPVSVESEFFYSIVAKELNRDTAQWERKCHVFIFDKQEDWNQFKLSGQLDPWTGGLCTGGELFLVRDSQRKWKGDTLGHEVTHLVVFRFVGAGIPLWLNEGFAEYAASRGYASFWRARGYKATPHSQAVNPAQWIPVTSLTSMVSYPADELQVITFYNESERLVRFLAGTDKPGFLKFLEAMAQGNHFDTALNKGFSNKFFNTDALEKAFKEYATKEHGTSLQDK